MNVYQKIVKWEFVRSLILWKNPPRSFKVFVFLNLMISYFTFGFFRYIVLFTTLCVALLYFSLDFFHTKWATTIQRGKTTAKEKESFEATLPHQTFCSIFIAVLKFTWACLWNLMKNLDVQVKFVISILMVPLVMLLRRVIFFCIGIYLWFVILKCLWMSCNYHGVPTMVSEIIKDLFGQESHSKTKARENLVCKDRKEPRYEVALNSTPLSVTSESSSTVSVTSESTSTVKPGKCTHSKDPKPELSGGTVAAAPEEIKTTKTEISALSQKTEYQKTSRTLQKAEGSTNYTRYLFGWKSLGKTGLAPAKQSRGGTETRYQYDQITDVVREIKGKFISGPIDPSHAYICSNYLQGQCTKDNQCSMHHLNTPYQWIYLHDGRWWTMNQDDNDNTEQLFCTPNISRDTISLKLSGVSSGRSGIYFVDFIRMEIGEKPLQRLSTKSQVHLPGCLFATKWCWFWKDPNRNFVEYKISQVNASEELEEQYLQGKTSYDFRVAEHKYRLYFKESPMYQKNMNPVYHTKREVRRRPFWKNRNLLTTFDVQFIQKIMEENQEKPFIPSSWERMDDHQEYKLVKLRKQQEEYKRIKSLFTSTMRNKTPAIKSIERLQNPFMFEKFSRKRTKMTKKASFCADPKQNTIERYLFHGTKEQNVPLICKNNFDWRLYGTSTGNIYGQGAYFATDASKSHSYCPIHENGYRYMFVALVLVGSYTFGKKDCRRPPFKYDGNPDGDMFDSCVDNVYDPKIFVVFDVDQYYPAYLVTYTARK